MSIDQRDSLLMEVEGLQARRREAIETYNSTGNRACMREAREASQAIADKLHELEILDSLTEAIDGLMGETAVA
jgi:hypothetical protein